MWLQNHSEPIMSQVSTQPDLYEKERKSPQMWDAMAGSQFVSYCLLTLHSWRDQKKSEYVKSEIPSVKVIQSNVREKKNLQLCFTSS